MNRKPPRAPGPPVLSLSPSLLRFLDALLRREWLVTNGLGGYASGTVAGVNTRRYHGLLVAALSPPVGRTVLVAKVDETIEADGRRWDLGTNEYHDGTISPEGYKLLTEFRLVGTLPVWTFALPEATLEKTVWMAREKNSTYARYCLLPGGHPVRLALQPYLTERDYHRTTRGEPGSQFAITPCPSGIRVVPWGGAVPYRLLVSRGTFIAGGMWYWKFLHRAERARGLDDLEDLYVPGRFEVSLRPGDEVTLLATAEPEDAPPAGTATDPQAEQPIHPAADPQAGPSLNAATDPLNRQSVDAAADLHDEQSLDGVGVLEQELARQDLLIEQAAGLPPDPEGIPGEGGLPARLVLAADQFLVRGATRRTVIAGYHWFTDWGRDTMIALPGLALATGRIQEAREILLSYAGVVCEGMLPNRFPDQGGPAEYTSADAALWYVYAVHRYLERVRDPEMLDRVLPAIREILERYRTGTRHGIRVDPRDGLLTAGAPGIALTWMDARVNGRVITPRMGKTADLNALWHNALRCAVRWETMRGGDSSAWETEADRVRSSFAAQFWYPAGEYLYDVIAPDGTPDPALRPNQILALSLPYPLVDGSRARAIVDAVSERLLTLFGLRSLAPGSPEYRGTYGGGVLERDEAYHQGSVWPWWLGPYVTAVVRVTGDRARARRLLEPFRGHLLVAGLGTVSEIFGGDPPHDPDGCIAQAWSVGALLDAWECVGGEDG